MRKEIEDVANELDGFEDLEPTDQEKIMAAFALGHVREQDTTPVLLDEKSSDAPANKGTKRRRTGRENADEDVAYESDDNDDTKALEMIENLPSKRARKPTQRYGASSGRPKEEDVASEEGGEDEEEEDEDDEDDEEEYEEED